jgi:hypothetical protein
LSEREERSTQIGTDGGVQDVDRAKLKWARGINVVALALAALGILGALFGSGASILPGGLGIMLGILGYFLGSNRLGTLTIVLCTAVLFFGLAASQGLIPGLERYDRTLPPEAPRSKDE